MVTKTDSKFPVTTSVLVGKPNTHAERINVYTVELPAEEVAEFYVESAHALANGFQRQLDKGRAEKIGKLMGSDRPHTQGGLLAYADEDEITMSTSGPRRLTLKRPLRLIDGQHRAAGARYAVENGLPHDWTETVRIVTGMTKQELAMVYLTVNVEARKVPPANIILDVAQMQGTILRRKSWVSRIVTALAAEEPFAIDGLTMVSWTPRDGGVISPQTLYRAVDILLPPTLNAEGEKEAEAGVFAYKAFSLYAELAGDDWFKQTEDKFVQSDMYSFTEMVAFAHVYKAVYLTEPENVEDIITNALQEVNLPGTLPEHIGSGERAAVALAAFISGKANIPLAKVAAA